MNFHISMKYLDTRGVQDLHESRSSSSWRKLARGRKDDGNICLWKKTCKSRLGLEVTSYYSLLEKGLYKVGKDFLAQIDPGDNVDCNFFQFCLFVVVVSSFFLLLFILFCFSAGSVWKLLLGRFGRNPSAVSSLTAFFRRIEQHNRRLLRGVFL